MALWRGLFARRSTARLRAAPAVRRQKNYAAATGYCYEYYYQGLADEGGCRRHFFMVSADRKSWFELVVLVEDRAVAAWQARHGRVLADNERYAIAKMALFDAFDTRPDGRAMAAPVLVASELAEEFLRRLGID